jgi:hypothetical protein
MSRIGSNLRKLLVWGMTLLAVITILSPAALRADACWDAFVRCATDIVAYIADPFHWMDCLNGVIFCYAYLPS